MLPLPCGGALNGCISPHLTQTRPSLLDLPTLLLLQPKPHFETPACLGNQLVLRLPSTPTCACLAGTSFCTSFKRVPSPWNACLQEPSKVCGGTDCLTHGAPLCFRTSSHLVNVFAGDLRRWRNKSDKTPNTFRAPSPSGGIDRTRFQNSRSRRAGLATTGSRARGPEDPSRRGGPRPTAPRPG